MWERGAGQARTCAARSRPSEGGERGAPDQGTYGVTSPHVPKPDEG